MVAVALLERSITSPGEHDVVFRGVEGALDDGRVVVLGDNDRPVTFGLAPVVGIIGMFASRVGKT